MRRFPKRSPVIASPACQEHVRDTEDCGVTERRLVHELNKVQYHHHRQDMPVDFAPAMMSDMWAV
jgi:hypothetical protein